MCIAIAIPSCRKTGNANPDVIKVGVEAGPEYVVAQTAQKVAKEKFGLEVELVQFTDYVTPNTVLAQKDIDLNAFQTKPYLEEEIKQRGYPLVAVGNTFVYPLAAYSHKIKTIDELADGSTIAIPNDVTNGGRALLLLDKTGLIKLKPESGLTARVIDIVENLHNFKIIEIEAAQLPRVLDDTKVAIALINNNYAASAGLLLKDGLFAEDKDSYYVNIIVAREDNKDDEKVKKFVQAYQSDEVAEAAEREFKGGAIKGWKD
ncbi:lipoprotein [Bacteroidia bacterium]|nr:lipoprotein [Bacteroidia bacterium]